jgi:Flp pilus assembly protein TadD
MLTRRVFSNPMALNLRQTDVEVSHARTERLYVRLAFGVLLGLFLLALAIWRGHHYYTHWQIHRVMREAHSAVERGEDRRATIAALRVVDLDAANAEACRLLAQLAEKYNDVSAMEWRRRIAEIEPGLVQNKIDLARTALKFNRISSANEALQKLRPEEKQSEEYHAIAARVALAARDWPSAESHLRAAVDVATEKAAPRLELALFLLRSRDTNKQSEGRAIAQELLGNAKAGAEAARNLIPDAVRRRDNAAAMRLGQQLITFDGATFADRLLYLSILKGVDQAQFTSYLTTVENEAAADPEKAVQLLSWMRGQGLAILGIEWLNHLPRKIANDLKVRIASAELYVHVRDWPQLQNLAMTTDWAQFEFVRLAILARVARETGHENGFETHWASAVRVAGTNAEALWLLEQNAAAWGWKKHAADLLWKLAADPNEQRTALETLYSYCKDERDAGGLYRVLLRMTSLAPGDDDVRNNLAQVSLLLKVETPRATATARELYEKAPNNSLFASTYAFALQQNGNLPEALKVMSHFKPVELRNPSVAMYYGILLAAAGKKEEAAQYLTAAEPERLFPEEQTLLQRAQSSLSQH